MHSFAGVFVGSLYIGFASSLLAVTMAGCAPPPEPPHAPVAVTTTAAQDPVTPEMFVEVAPEPAAPATAPRLSRVVTLGQGSEEAYQPAPAQEQGQSQSQSVVVNNTIIVGQQPYYGGYGGYGYGGYGGGYGGGYTTGARGYGVEGSRSPASNGGSRPWGSSAWSGAQRTAAPGHTPSVGGNWSAPHSSGPAQMK